MVKYEMEWRSRLEEGELEVMNESIFHVNEMRIVINQCMTGNS